MVNILYYKSEEGKMKILIVFLVMVAIILFFIKCFIDSIFLIASKEFWNVIIAFWFIGFSVLIFYICHAPLYNLFLYCFDKFSQL